MVTYAPDLDGWVSPTDLAQAGFRPSGPEIDYGMRWGERLSISVSFAPRDGSEFGYLYAHDRSTGRCRLLVPETTADAVEDAWQVLRDAQIPDAHLAFPAVINGDQPLRPDHAHALWKHCVEREVDARQTYRQNVDPDRRPSLRRDVRISEAARTSAEAIHRESISHTGAEPVIVRYRVAEWPGWYGR